MRRSARALPLYLLVLACLVTPGRGTEAPLGFDDLAELVRSGVPDRVIRSLLRTSEPVPLSVAQWVELRELGASDELLLALLEDQEARKATDPDSVEAVPPEAGVRAFYRDEPEGGQVFVLTNLDESGRRMGGEVTAAVRTNVVAGLSAEEFRAEQEVARELEPSEPAPTDRVPPVQVNVGAYPPLLDEYVAPSGPVAYVPLGGYRYGRGLAWQYPFSHFYPPGSYTHLKVYHQSGSRGFAHYQLPAGQIFYNPPFRGAGSHRRR